MSQGMEMTQIYGGNATGFSPCGRRYMVSQLRAVRCMSLRQTIRKKKFPPVAIDRIVIDGQEQAPATDMVLSSGTKKVQFNYSAASLRSPEDIRFRYKLDGFDQSWMDSGDERQVYYTKPFSRTLPVPRDRVQYG